VDRGDDDGAFKEECFAVIVRTAPHDVRSGRVNGLHDY
jgi:hypothetical protein